MNTHFNKAPRVLCSVVFITSRLNVQNGKDESNSENIVYSCGRSSMFSLIKYILFRNESGVLFIWWDKRINVNSGTSFHACILLKSNYSKEWPYNQMWGSRSEYIFFFCWYHYNCCLKLFLFWRFQHQFWSGECIFKFSVLHSELSRRSTRLKNSQ